jgi:hypothetical protein
MSSMFEARKGRARRVSAALAAVACLASVSSASAGQLWVGTRNPVTGQITVRNEVLKQTFPNGAPVGSYSIREVTDGLFEISNGFLLIRRTAAGVGTCQTEATPVIMIAGRLYLDMDAAVHVVLHCANPDFPTCTSCKVERDLEGYFCACVNNGDTVGECLGQANDILKGQFTVEWQLPIPDPTPSPHGN